MRFKLFYFLITLCSAPILAIEFVHPGGLSSKAELDFVKGKINAGVQPWKGEFDQLKSSSYATREPHGLEHINSENKDADISRDDAIAAYAQALLWYYSGDESYGHRSIAILNSWASLKGFTAGSDQDKLQAGWIGAVFGQAAEIMHTHPDWNAAEIKKLQVMFKRAFYPQLMTASRWNGNVDLSQIDALMVLSVFNEDEAGFKAACKRLKARSKAYFYLASDGSTPPRIEGDGNNIKAFWSHPTRWVDGLTQETCRDNGHHSQFGLGSALHASEVAWHQGVDLYLENQERYTAAMELMATHFLAGSMQGLCKEDTPSRSRFDAWEIGYNHYHRRLGVALPKTQKLIAKQIRAKAPRAVCNLVYDMLTHADLPANLSPLGKTKE